MRLLSIALLAALSAGAGETLENASMRIEFADSGRGFNVERIVSRSPDVVGFGAATSRFARFWLLEFASIQGGSNRIVSVVSANPSCERSCEFLPGEARFHWRGLSLPDEPRVLDVSARVRLRGNEPLSDWDIQVDNRGQRWALTRTVFPIVTCLVPVSNSTAKVLVPTKGVGGRVYAASEWSRSPIGHNFALPSCRLPVMAAMRDGVGLYFAAHDPEARAKSLVLANDTTAWCETLVENAGSRKAANGPKFSITIGTFRGDWWSAAHIYRDWALKQAWAAKGKIANRADFPKRAAETHLWVIGGGMTNKAAACFQAMDRVWPEVGKALTWSEWSEKCGGKATNRGDPEFFPGYPGIGALARDRVSAGYLVFPYLNARIWDVANASFAYAQTDATKQSSDECQTETYADNWGATNRFAVMCPAVPTWQKVVARLAARCLDELGMNGVYFDQVSCSPPKPCYDSNHGHPLGGGAWWASGYRQMFTGIKAEFSKRGAAVVSEQLGETWLDLIDVYLNGIAPDPHDVPLSPAVYSGYCVHYGRPVSLNLPRPAAFRQYAQTLIWGEAFGWIPPGVPQYRAYAERAQLLYELAKFRRDHAEFLVYGTLEGPLPPPNDTDHEVFGTVWRNAKGDRTCGFLVDAKAQTVVAVPVAP